MIRPPPAAAAAHPVAWAAYAGAPVWQPARHLRWLGERVRDLEAGRSLRLVVSMPPRHGKSEFLARFTPSWWLGRHPESEVIYVTMQERFSRSWARKARDDFSEHGERLWGVTTPRRSSTAQWDVFRRGRRTGGSLSAVGAGGTITGKGAGLLVVDDLYRHAKDLQSARLREERWEWFRSACLTRLTPDGRVIILMTRWHHDDLIGRLMKAQAEGEYAEQPWEFVNLPAISDEEDDPLGRAPGDALWPAKFSTRVLERRRSEVGPSVWEALYQGRPTPRQGKIFKREWLLDYTREGKVISVPSRGTCEVDSLYKFGVVDLAGSKKRRADYTVVSVWGFHPRWKVLLLLDVVRDRVEGQAIVPLLLHATTVHNLPIVHVERLGPWLEAKLGSIIKEAARAGVPIDELVPEEDKEHRAYAATGAFAAGQVLFPKKADWRPVLEEELLTFPEGAHDDQVDCVTYAVGIFRELLDRYRESELERRAEEAPGAGETEWWTGARDDEEDWT